MLVLLLGSAFNFLVAQSTFTDEFLSKYTAILSEQNQEFEVTRIEKLLEKEKLDNFVVTAVYASYFNYKDVDKANRVLLVAYALEYEKLNTTKFYKQATNLLMEKSIEAFTTNWTKYTEGKKITDDALILFVEQELKRLEKEGLDVKSIKALIN